MTPKTKVIIGIVLVFISGLLSSYFISVVLIEFGGARLYDDIKNSNDITDVQKPDMYFIVSLLVTGSYGLPFLIIGIYLIMGSVNLSRV